MSRESSARLPSQSEGRLLELEGGEAADSGRSVAIVSLQSAVVPREL